MAVHSQGSRPGAPGLVEDDKAIFSDIKVLQTALLDICKWLFPAVANMLPDEIAFHRM